MATLLHIDSSAFAGQASTSRAVTPSCRMRARALSRVRAVLYLLRVSETADCVPPEPRQSGAGVAHAD